MPSEFVDYLAEYLQKQSEKYKGLLTEAYANKDHCISVLAYSGGVAKESKELRDLELLCDAKIFQESMQFSHSGRNMFKNFCLTELGVKLAQGLKNEGALTVESP